MTQLAILALFRPVQPLLEPRRAGEHGAEPFDVDGVEADAALYYREPRYSADLSFGYYVPGAAFNGKTGRERLDSVVAIYEGRDGFASTYGSDVTAGNAWTVQSKFNWAF